ncbi:MAG: iron chelate uptake ABC transporter family permease subunit, partial [Clostridiales bacterium]|nr:iron chelate uptake ABC transporter family permease subunit [Clostridiales bacterium]
MKIQFKKHQIFIGLLFIMVIVMVWASVVGAADISVVDSFKIIASHIPYIGKNIDLGDISKSHITIISNIRLPRILLAFMVGYALSVSGATLQGLLKNPMADPFIMGTSSGAALGAAIAILFKLDKVFLGMGYNSV